MAIRYIPGTEFRNDGQFVVSDATDFCTELQGQLITVQWDTLSGTRSGAYLRKTLFGIQQNTTITIGANVYYIQGSIPNPNPGAWATVIFAGTDSATTYINLGQAVNSNGFESFRCVQAGYMTTTTTDGGPGTGSPSINGIDIESISLSPDSNGTSLLPAADNATMWFGYSTASAITDAGGYRMRSKLTSEYQRCRALMYVAGTTAQVKITSGDESYTSAAFAPSTTNGLIYRQISNPYQFYLLTPGATSSFLFGGTPALPDFLKGQRITGCTNESPIRITTESAHGLTTGEQVSITDAEETYGITSVDSAPLYGSPLVLIRPFRIQVVTAGHEFTVGQVVSVSGVTGATGANGDWKIREVDATSFVLRDAHNDFATAPYAGAGVVQGTRNCTNGLWTVTVIDDLNFTLDTSDGTNAGSYVANTGIAGKNNNDGRRISRCLFMTGTGSGNSFRTSMYHAQTGAYALNASNYTGGDNIGSPRTVFPGILGGPLLWSDDCAVLCEPYLTLGINGIASQARLIGQPWDCALITQDYTDESTAVFDGYNWVKVTGTTSGSLQWGSLWVAISVVP